MSKLNMALLNGIEDAENQIALERQETPQKAPKPTKPKRSTMKEKKVENVENMKPQKQVFSFRASVDDIAAWKAYATATGKTMESLGSAAMNEYMAKHKLTEEENTIFQIMKSKNVDK